MRYTFFKILEITSTGENVFKELKIIIEKNGLSLSKMIGVSTDGASSMLGCHSGVVKTDRFESLAIYQRLLAK